MQVPWPDGVHLSRELVVTTLYVNVKSKGEQWKRQGGRSQHAQLSVPSKRYPSYRKEDVTKSLKKGLNMDVGIGEEDMGN